MTKLEKLRDLLAESHSLKVWPKEDHEYEGTHVAEEEYPEHYRHSVFTAYKAGFDKGAEEMAKMLAFKDAQIEGLVALLESARGWVVSYSMQTLSRAAQKEIKAIDKALENFRKEVK